MKKIYVIGFMGCGKTTVSRYLSKKTGLSYVDIDELVEKNRLKKIKTIFRDEGEAAFRKYETEALIATDQYHIISTGGGIVEKSENIQHMRETGIILYLQASLEVIEKRINNDGSRPLWNDLNEVKKLYDKRIQRYEACADYIINSDNLTIEELGKRIVEIAQYKAISKSEEY